MWPSSARGRGGRPSPCSLRRYGHKVVLWVYEPELVRSAQGDQGKHLLSARLQAAGRHRVHGRPARRPSILPPISSSPHRPSPSDLPSGQSRAGLAGKRMLVLTKGLETGNAPSHDPGNRRARRPGAPPARSCPALLSQPKWREGTSPPSSSPLPTKSWLTISRR